ncbi:alpha/beta fold hydrolase [Novosphingobium bradum]|uniref:Alpha/beta fold hydrolase n=1 Tax=Novosphingobium bradum TaxID=1737444 RepID=A0ABV7ISB1_9SPHN
MYYPRALPRRRQLNGITFECLERGEGPPLLYLHASEGLDPDEAVIARLAENFRVIAPAHPGFGLSELPRTTRTVDDLAYFYLDLIDAEGWDDLTVVGSSFGGWLALEIATKYAHRIGRLVLDNPLGLRFAERADRDFIDLFQLPPPDWSRHFLAGAPEDERDWSAEPEDVALRAARNREAFTRFGWAPYLHSPALKARLHRAAMPALVLWGEEDAVASRGYAEAVARVLPQARFQAIAGAGHYAFHDQPEAVARAVADFALTPQAAAQAKA